MSIIPGQSRHACVAVVKNTEVALDTFLLSLDARPLSAEIKPGQFFMISFPQLLDPLLPRPFAAFNVERGCLEILFRKVGKGTLILSEVQKGDILQVLGPLGRGYQISQPLTSRPLVFAGGIGFASVYFLVKHLLSLQHPVTLLYGSRSVNDLYPMEPAMRKENLLDFFS